MPCLPSLQIYGSGQAHLEEDVEGYEGLLGSPRLEAPRQ